MPDAHPRRIDPRGIMRRITAVEWSAEGNSVTFDCGHVGRMAAHFSFRVGSECRCFACGEEARAAAMQTDDDESPYPPTDPDKERFGS